VSLVTVMFPHQGRTGTVSLDWSKGKTAQMYFHDPHLKLYALCAKKLRCAMYNGAGQKVKLNYQPKPNDILVLMESRRSR